MKARLAILLCLIWVVSCSPHITTTPDMMKENRLVDQLVRVAGALQQSTFEQKEKGDRADIKSAVEGLIARNGKEFLGVGDHTGGWLAINPISENWGASTNVANEIAVYNPIQQLRGNEKVSFAITFGGKFVHLKELPSWSPVTLP